MDDNRYVLGQRIIESAINLDQALIDLLKLEVKRLKRLNADITVEELELINNLVKKIIFSLSLSEEKIRLGTELIISAKGS
ncbi:MAG TPA: hypothetical protein PLZ84_08035 [Clostridia bacterium]|nr:hypothetical protein [Clostridia bacterium]